MTTVKNDKPRTIMPAKFVMDLLLAQRSKQSRWQLLAGELWQNPHNLVFTNELGGHLYRGTVYKNFKDIACEMGLPNMRFHDLRHSYAVASIRAGDDIKTVQSNLGHHTAAFTLDVYGHATDQMKQESANRMDRFIQGLWLTIKDSGIDITAVPDFLVDIIKENMSCYVAEARLQYYAQVDYILGSISYIENDLSGNWYMLSDEDQVLLSKFLYSLRLIREISINPIALNGILSTFVTRALFDNLWQSKYLILENKINEYRYLH